MSADPRLAEARADLARGRAAWRDSIIVQFIIVLALFLVAAYLTVSSHAPGSIPVHHDDYGNYAMRFANAPIAVRPVSMAAIALLATLGDDTLIWAVRLGCALYVLLCIRLALRLQPRRDAPLFVAAVAALVFSAPMTVEYARYTGLLTHLLSGCLALAATLLLHAACVRRSLPRAVAAAALMLASILAKEDFVLLYLLAAGYFALTIRPGWRVLGVALSGLPLAAAWLVLVRIRAASSFLGVPDPTSSYFLDLSPASVVTTVVRYLSSAGHPVMQWHGNLTVTVFVATLLACVAAWTWREHRALFLLAAVLALMAPYSLLPNHVNPYYEMIWLPFLYLALLGAITALLARLPGRLAQPGWQRVLVFGVIVSLLAVVATIDLPGRRGVAAWYDERAAENAADLDALRRHVAAHPQPNVCVTDAGAFSPFYMHGAHYLEAVLGLQRHWRVVVEPGSALEAGFRTGEHMGAGRMSLASAAQDCSVVDLGGNGG